MWDGFNQRKFPRLNLRCEIKINLEAESRSIQANTENVGSGGVCLIQTEPLERFSRCYVLLELDKDLPGIKCEGKVAWVIPRKNPLSKDKVFDTGIEFVKLKPEDQERLRAFILSCLQSGFKEIR